MLSTGCSSRSISPRPALPTSSRCASGIRRSATRSSGSAGSSRRTASRSSPRRVAALEGVAKERHFTFEHDGVLLHGFLDVFHERDGRALVLDYKTNAARGRVAGGDRRAGLPAAGARLRARVLPGGRGRGRGRVPFPRAAGRRGSSTDFGRAQVPDTRGGAVGRDRAHSRRGVPADAGDFACTGCPALDVVCAGPRLRARSAARPQSRRSPTLLSSAGAPLD